MSELEKEIEEILNFNSSEVVDEYAGIEEAEWGEFSREGTIMDLWKAATPSDMHDKPPNPNQVIDNAKFIVHITRALKFSIKIGHNTSAKKIGGYTKGNLDKALKSIKLLKLTQKAKQGGGTTSMTRLRLCFQHQDFSIQKQLRVRYNYFSSLPNSSTRFYTTALVGVRLAGVYDTEVDVLMLGLFCMQSIALGSRSEKSVAELLDDGAKYYQIGRKAAFNQTQQETEEVVLQLNALKQSKFNILEHVSKMTKSNTSATFMNLMGNLPSISTAIIKTDDSALLAFPKDE